MKEEPPPIIKKEIHNYTRKGIGLDNLIVEKIFHELNPLLCPVCGNYLSHKDNFNFDLPNKENIIERYCSKDNYIIRLKSEPYNCYGTKIILEIRTNSLHSQLLAKRGFTKEINPTI